jgi:hypothetical protein
VPSVSKKQHNLMAAVAHDPAFAKKVGIKQSVGKEFAQADKGKTFKSGGRMPISMKQKSVEDMKKGIFAPKDKDEKSDSAMKKGGKVKKMASGGMTSMGKVKTAAPSRDGIAVKGKTKGKMVVMSGNKGMKKGGYC